MKKRFSRAWAAALCVSAACTAGAAGFGLYEMDAASTALGGNVVAKPRNASANYYNPAGLSALTGTWVTAGMTMLMPQYDIKVDGVNRGKATPGWFGLPHVHLSQELPWDFTAGLAFYPEYGLGSRYDPAWVLANDSFETLFEGYCLNPNLSYRITDRWSFALGLRAEYVHFMTRTMQGSLGELKLEADNNVDYGFQAGTVYRLFDDFHLGAVYRSRIRSKMKGKAEWRALDVEGVASDKIYMPPSVTLGYNWDRAFGWDPFHFAGSVAWTGWSTIDSMSFDVPLVGVYNMNMGWHNSYRAGIGFGYDVTETWEALIGYVYDWDPSRSTFGQAKTMLPAGDRHNVYLGLDWQITERLDIALAYGVIILVSTSNDYPGVGYAAGDTSDVHTMHAHSSFTHCVAATLNYHF